jgi:hypothetical protein
MQILRRKVVEDLMNIADLVRIFLVSAEGSFIQVTVFVGIVLLLFGYIDYRYQGAFIRAIENAKGYQPLIGALLGIIPGCGGSILVMPLYVKNTVSFGAVLATLIATAGDSAFVTMTQAPKDFALITVLCLIVGAVSGTISDRTGLSDWVKARSSKRVVPNLKEKHEEAERLLDGQCCDAEGTCRSCNLVHIGHEEGDEIDMILHHQKPLDMTSLGYRITHHAYVVFWVVLAVGFVFGILDLMQVDLNAIPRIPNAGTMIGVSGTAVTIIYTVASKKFVQATSHEDMEHKFFSLKETFIHNAEETAFVGLWVFGAYFVYEVAVHFMGGDQVIASLLTASGLMSVFLGVLIGIIPGCGPQVIFVSLYLKGMFPFAALLANAISQDGDALFPLIALDRKSAFWSTVINTIVALIVGLAAYFLTAPRYFSL